MLDEANFFWGVFVAVVGAAWIVMVFIRDRNAETTQNNTELVKRIHETDQMVIEQPSIQKYLSRTAAKPEEFFRSPEVLEEDEFYKAKALAYWHLNLFDDIVSMARNGKWRPSFLAREVIEISDWETYMKRKLRHPLFRSIMNNEGAIFGASLREFWASNKDEITAQPADPYEW